MTKRRRTIPTLLASTLVCWGAMGAEPPDLADEGTPTAGETTGARAPAGDPEPPEAKPRPRKPEEKDGFRAGSFRIYPEASLAEIYDDNIFAARDDEVADYITVLSPVVRAVSDWAKHQLSFSAGGSIARYQDNDSEDYDDYWVNTRGLYELSPNSNIFGGVVYSEEHEERFSPDDVNGTEPTTYTDTNAYVGFFRRFGKIALRMGGTTQRLDFDDVPSTTGIINNDDRDRRQHTLGARLSRRIGPLQDIFVQGIYDRRLYEDSLDDNLINRDSEGYSFAVGWARTFSGGGEAEAYVGYLSQDYEDSQIPDVDAVDFGALWRTDLSPRTWVSASLNRTLEETTLNNASSYLYTSATVRGGHRLSGRTTLTSRFTFGRADYQGIDRTDDHVVAGLGASYRLAPHWIIEADYRFLNRDTDVAAADYYKNQLMLRLRGLLYPVRKPIEAELGTVVAGTPGRADYGGLYVGLQAGYGPLISRTFGLRGGGGFDTGEFGNDGAVYGPFLGYGWMGERWYGGLELEAESSDADWDHVKQKPTSRTFSVDKRDTVGISARVGRTLYGGALLYGRLGVVETDFDTYYTINNAPANAYDARDTQTGVRYGIGVEVPATNHVFWRMDYTLTDYDEYDVDYVTGAESFDNDESLFRVGLGWRFGARDPYRRPHPDIDYDGFYVGGFLVQDSVQSQIDATHQDSSSPPSYPFAADFADVGGGAGVFAGYGVELNRWYIGIEGEAEGSRTNWRHVRETGGAGGRDFAVDKKGGYGLSLRLGYALRSGALIYGKVGAVRTKFNTDYVKGGNSANWIDRDDKLDGTRLGIGAEVPASENVFVRLDYSQTDYDEYGFTTAHTNFDIMNYENSESMFSLGVLMRF